MGAAFRKIGFEEARALHTKPPGAATVPAALVHPPTGRRSLFSSVNSGYADDFHADGTVTYARSTIPAVNAAIDAFAAAGQPVDYVVHAGGRNYYHARVRVLPRKPGARAYTLVVIPNV
jgi:hypothetical protein